jgi:hypothetical protein
MDNHWQARLPDPMHEHLVRPVRVEARHDDGAPASNQLTSNRCGMYSRTVR